MVDSPSVTVFDRPLYSTGEAARLLQVPPQTLRRWLEGITVGGTSYPPVLRSEPTGIDAVTWGEFLEAGLLREYRLNRVPLQRMRPFIERARERLGVPYPLAHLRPAIDADRSLVWDLQKEFPLEDKLRLVLARDDDRLQWATPVERYFSKVEFDPVVVVARRVRPLGQASPVAIDPEVAFGLPQIRGIRTENIAESYYAGEDWNAIARTWGVSEEEARAAVAWEESLRLAA